MVATYNFGSVYIKLAHEFATLRIHSSFLRAIGQPTLFGSPLDV